MRRSWVGSVAFSGTIEGIWLVRLTFIGVTWAIVSAWESFTRWTWVARVLAPLVDWFSVQATAFPPSTSAAPLTTFSHTFFQLWPMTSLSVLGFRTFDYTISWVRNSLLRVGGFCFGVIVRRWSGFCWVIRVVVGRGAIFSGVRIVWLWGGVRPGVCGEVRIIKRFWGGEIVLTVIV